MTARRNDRASKHFDGGCDDFGWACWFRSRRRASHQRHRTPPSVEGPRWIACRAAGVARLRWPLSLHRQAHPSAPRPISSGSSPSVVRVGPFQPVAPGLERACANGAWRAAIAATANQARNCVQAFANLPIAPQSRDAIASPGTIHDPPTVITFDNARYPGAFAASIPPVGQNFTCANGPENARNAPMPPLDSAGKNLNRTCPASSPRINSLAVAIAGMKGIAMVSAAAYNASVAPGAIANTAPASITAF